MAVSDHLKPGLTDKSRVKIMTVDPATRRVEGAFKDGSMIQIAVWDVPNAFRWPKDGETWIVRRDNGIWMLDHRQQQEQDETAQPLTQMLPGDMKLDADRIFDSSGHKVLVSDEGPLNPLWPEFGAKGDLSVDDTAALNKTIAALPPEGGTILLPGKFLCTGQLNFDNRRAVILQGLGGISAGASTASMLLFTQAGNQACISARATFGFTIRDVAVLNTNASYTGDVINLSATVETAFCRLENMLLFAEPAATRLLNLNNATGGHFDTVHFNGAQYAVQGVLGTVGTNTNYSNAHTFSNCIFKRQVLDPIVNPGQAWCFNGPTVEPTVAGAASFMSIAASNWAGIAINGGWFGDANATGAWIYINAAGGGFSLRGSEFGAGTDALLINSSTHGLDIVGNKFDFCQYGVNIQAGLTVSDSLFINDATTCTSSGVVKGAGVTLTRVIITDTKAGTGDMYGITVH